MILSGKCAASRRSWIAYSGFNSEQLEEALTY
jgi:hypothetical protein